MILGVKYEMEAAITESVRQKAAVNLTAACSYTILFFFETLSESLHNRIKEVSHDRLLSYLNFDRT